MPIVFACPRCKMVMKAPDDQGGVRIKCLQCSISMEIPFLRGILVDVPPEQATPVVFGVTVPKPGSGAGVAASKFGSAPGTTRTPTAKESRADEWLREAGDLKDKNDMEGAIRLLQRAFEEIKRDSLAYPVEIYLRLPIYLQQAGRSKEAWQEFSRLLFFGYPNQPKDQARLPLDRGRVLEKMRLALDRESKGDAGQFYGVLSQVCEAAGLFRDDRKREAVARLNKTTCQEIVSVLGRFTGNLGALQDVRTVAVEEVGKWPDIDLEQLANRLDAAFAAQARSVEK